MEKPVFISLEASEVVCFTIKLINLFGNATALAHLKENSF